MLGPFTAAAPEPGGVPGTHDGNLHAPIAVVADAAAASLAADTPGTAQVTALALDAAQTDAQPLVAAPAQSNAATASARAGGAMQGLGAPVVDQAAPVFISLANRDGAQSVSLRLAPEELGRLDIRIEREAGGASTVSLTAERPETLALLERDQVQLHRALDDAGIAPEGRTILFHLAQSPTDAAITTNAGGGGTDAGGRSAGQPGSASAQLSSYDASGNGTGHGAGSPSDQGRGSNAGAPRSLAAAPQDRENTQDTTADASAARWTRAGVDITA
jgi:flagellar hook-length control protein FliK